MVAVYGWEWLDAREGYMGGAWAVPDTCLVEVVPT